jgi:hypothetical protein
MRSTRTSSVTVGAVLFLLHAMVNFLSYSKIMSEDVSRGTLFVNRAVTFRYSVEFGREVSTNKNPTIRERL